MISEPAPRRDEDELRALVPRVLAGLVRRGEDFDAAEDALQEALLEALRAWPGHPPRDPRAWLTTVATRRLVDARRSESARQRREDATYAEPLPAATEEGDDTLFLLFCCCHPGLAPASQVALTLRAVGGLTTREIADAFYVPEATMAQRISRAKRTLHGRSLDQPGDLAVVLRVLYLIYSAGHAGRVDLASEAIRLARQLTLATQEPEAHGLLALMLLSHARLPARLDSQGRIVTLDQQDRGRWDAREIAEGVRVLQSALAAQRPGRYQAEAAIAALHDDAASAGETDWPQILAWYDDLVALTGDPVHQDPAAVLGRAVAVGHVLGAAAGLRETDRLREVIGDRHRWHAVRGYLHELAGDLPAAAAAYAEAARRATNVAERDHLVRQAARARAAGLGSRSSVRRRTGGNMTVAVTTVVSGQHFLEAPRWRDGRIWFSDFYGHQVQSAREDGSDLRVEATVDQQPAGLGWLPDGRLLVVSMVDRKVLRREPDGTLVTHADLSSYATGHANDMAVDAAGRAYVGNFGFDLMSGSPLETASLHRVDPDGTVTEVATDLWFPNGTVITPGNVLIVNETFGNRSTAFDLTEDGRLVNRRVWAEFAPLPSDRAMDRLFPELKVAGDGCCLDSEGALWLADADNARLLRVAEGGHILDEIDPGSPVYACALGGADGRTLFACAAPDFFEAPRKAAREASLLAIPVSVPA